MDISDIVCLCHAIHLFVHNNVKLPSLRDPSNVFPTQDLSFIEKMFTKGNIEFSCYIPIVRAYTKLFVVVSYRSATVLLFL